VVTVRVFEELNIIKDRSSLLVLGITIVEDILAITILAVLQSVAAAGENLSIVGIAISISIVAAFIGSILIVGSRFMPKIIDKASKTNS
jgi:CPA2 family monovalent cation:H+ antiporter-2